MPDITTVPSTNAAPGAALSIARSTTIFGMGVLVGKGIMPPDLITQLVPYVPAIMAAAFGVYSQIKHKQDVQTALAITPPNPISTMT
jgi:hypothetical protein